MGKLVCPHCGDSTAPVPFVFKAEILFKESRLAPVIPTYPYMEGTAKAVTPYMSDQPTYGVIVCQSCKEHFVAEKKAGEWSAVYPIQHKTVATEIPEPIRGELEEANLCFAVGAYRACVSMCETALEAIWQDKKVSGLKELRDNGIISDNLFKRADQVRRWANVVKHQLIHEAVTREEAEQLLSYLEQILDTVYVEEKQLSDLTQKLKQVESKPKAP